MKIGMFGFDFKSSNKGCEALTYTFLSMMDGLFPDEKIEAFNFTYNNSLGIIPDQFKNITFNICKLNFSNPSFWRNSIKTIKKCDLFFDATYGDGFSDIYGKKWNVKTDLVKEMVIFSGVPLVLLPQTYGPFSSKLLEKWAMHIVKKSKLVYSRDALSAKIVKDTCNHEIKVASDMAFKLPYNKSKYEFNTDKVKIGINISSLLWDSEWSKVNHFGLTVDYQEFHLQLIDQLLSEGKYEIYIIPHVINLEMPNDRENDYRVCLKMKEKFNTKINIAPAFDTPIEAKSYISNMDVFIGSRMHSTIGSISSGVATIPFSYSRKFEGLFGNLNYPYVISAKQISTEEALEKAYEWITNYHDLQVTGNEAVLESLKKLDCLEEDIKHLYKEQK